LGENELKMAALLHTEVAFHDRRAVLFHLKSARNYLNRIEDDTARTRLLRRWYLAVSKLLRGSMQSWAALHLVQDALQMFPQDPEILLAVGSVYDAAGWMGISGMLERSEKFYREILVTQPENAEVHLRLGRVMQLRDRSEEALRELNLSLEYAPEAETRFVAHMLIGHVLSQLGRMPEAVEAFRESLEIDPHCQAAVVALSHALHRSGDRPGSREVLSLFLAQNGDSPRQPDRWMRYLYGGTELLDTTMPETRKELMQ
jgi:tetratricopeptide (TPR) repeat protein